MLNHVRLGNYLFIYQFALLHCFVWCVNKFAISVADIDSFQL